MTTFADPGQYPSGGGDQSRNVDVNLDANVSGYTRNVSAAQQETAALSTAVSGLSGHLSDLTKTAGHTLEHLSVGSVGGLAAATADAASLQKQLGTLNATSAITGVSMRGLKGDVVSATGSFPVMRGQVVGLVQEISGLGVVGVQQIGSLTRTVIKLSAASGEAMPQLANGLIQFSRLMGETDVTKIGDLANTVLTVSKNAGVSVGGVLDFAQAIAPLARQAGIGSAAVLGIATAFKKAGQDGYYAANTFNSIVSDIATLERTGSPTLAKYSNLVGQSTSQFRSRGIEQNVLDLFGAFGSNSPQVANFIDQNYGIRAQSALAGVAQSGDLQTYISQALGASGNQDNLNKGSRAAFNNLVDTGAQIRNELTEMGDTIGSDVLPVLTALGRGLDDFLHITNEILRSLGPLPAIFGAVAGVLAPLAVGFGLSHLGVLGTLGTARLLFGRNSLANQARVAGRADAGLAEGAALSTLGTRIAAGDQDVLLRERLGYAAGSRSGAGLLGVLPLVGRANRQPTEPMPIGAVTEGAVRKLTSAELAGMSSGEIAAYYGISHSQLLRRVAARSPEVVRAYADDNATMVRAANMSAEDRAALARERAARGAGGVYRETLNNAAFSVASGQSGTQAAGRAVRDAAMATGRTVGATAVEGMRAGLAGTARLARGALGMGLSAGRSLLTSPVGLAFVGLPLAMSGIGALTGMAHRAAAQNNNFTGDLNPAADLNSQLGLTTQYLAHFGAAVTSATNDLNGSGKAAPSLAGLRTVAPQTYAAQQGKPLADDKASQAIGALRQHGNLTVANATALVQSLITGGATDPKALQAIQNALISSGMARKDVQQVFSSLISSGGTLSAAGPNGQQVARAVLNTETGRNSSTTGNQIEKAFLSSVGVNYQQNLDTHSAAYAQVKQLNDLLPNLTTLGAQSFRGGSSRMYALLNALNTVSGGNGSDMDQLKYAFQNGFGNSALGTPQGIIDLLSQSGAGRKFLTGIINTQGVGGQITGTFGPHLGTQIDATKLAAFLASNNQTTAAPGTPMSTLSNVPALFGMTLNPNSAFNRAQSDLGNLGLQQTAAEQALNAALSSTATTRNPQGDYTKAAAILLQGINRVGGSASGPAGGILDAAQQLARAQQQTQLPLMSRVAQGRTLLSNLQSSRTAALAPNATAEAQQTYGSDVAAYQQYESTQAQHLASMLQAERNFGIQMQRADQDYQHSIYLQERNFDIQMEHMQRDYLISRQRTVEDYNTQLKNTNEQTAQSIYDPFTRLQAKYTTDAGSTLQNLREQNAAISKQRSELDRLSHMGLSTQAIQTLDLANPNNAQQTDRLVQDLLQDPKLLAQINAQVKTRVAATGSLTQNDYNLQFAQSQKAFQVQLQRTSADYKRAVSDANQQEQLSLQDMAYNYTTMVKRSGQDLQNSIKEISGTFEQLYPKVMGAYANAVAKYSPQAAAYIRKDLTALAKEFPGLSLTGINPSPVDVGTANSNERRMQDRKNPPPVALPSGEKHPSPAPHALGGIATRAQVGEFGEAGPEALIPLNQRGQEFMTGLIAKSLGQAITYAYRAAPAAPAPITEDHSVNFTGPISVAASDPREMQRKLDAQAKLTRLRSPVRR